MRGSRSPGATETAEEAPRRQPSAPAGTNGPNPVWSADFVFDWCADGQRLKCLTVRHEGTKEGLAVETGGLVRSRQVPDVLSRLVSERDAPHSLRVDAGRSSSPGPIDKSPMPSRRSCQAGTNR